jgi:hypothetical protein
MFIAVSASDFHAPWRRRGLRFQPLRAVRSERQSVRLTPLVSVTPIPIAISAVIIVAAIMAITIIVVSIIVVSIIVVSITSTASVVVAVAASIIVAPVAGAKVDGWRRRVVGAALVYARVAA